MRARAGRALIAFVVAALLAAPLASVAPDAVGADECPEAVFSGHWTGGGLTGGGAPFTLDSIIEFDGSSMTGTVSINGGAPTALSGTLDCQAIGFGVVFALAEFEGTMALSGQSMTGTYNMPGDAGTWYQNADVGPYELTATSTAQPTEIGAGAATSWYIDVENTGGSPASAVQVEFFVSGSGAFGPLSQASVTQGTGCVADDGDPLHVTCHLGTLAPGQAEGAQVIVESNGGAGTQIFLDGLAASAVGGGTDAYASTVTVSVVSAGELPPGTVSGIARPGVTFSTPGTATATNPIVVKLKLPKKVTAGTTLASAQLSPRRSKRERAFEGATLVSYRRGGARPAARQALGRPAAKQPAPAVPMSISLVADEAATFCGGAACSGSVIHLTSFAGYNDPKSPAKVTITWDASVRGRGTASTIYKRGDSRNSPLQTVPSCLKVKKLGYTNLPCVFKRKQQKSGDVQFTVLLLSGDPKFARR